MSMNTYYLQDVCFLVDEETAAYIHLAFDAKDASIPKEIQGCLSDGTFAKKARAGGLPEEYGSVELASELLGSAEQSLYYSDFYGVAAALLPDKAGQTEDVEFENDILLCIRAQKDASLFEAAYSTPEELLDEFKQFFESLNVNLPDDFAWWSHIVTVSGTFCC